MKTINNKNNKNYKTNLNVAICAQRSVEQNVAGFAIKIKSLVISPRPFISRITSPTLTQFGDANNLKESKIPRQYLKKMQSENKMDLKNRIQKNQKKY